MSAALPATHLLRRYLLFALTVVFLLTTIRAGYVLWQFQATADAGALVSVFVQGLRFDLALVGMLLIVPVALFSLLSMLKITRGLTKFLTGAWLMVALLFVIVAELASVWFMAFQSSRPGPAEWTAVEDPLGTLVQVLKNHPAPALIGGALCLLILIAFTRRLELNRLMTFRVGVISAFALAILGSIACLFAIWSGPVIGQKPLSVADASVSSDPMVNNIALNTGFRLLSSTVDDVVSRVVPSSD